MKKLYRILFVIFIIAPLFASCSKYLRLFNFYQDQKDITVQFLSLFNQDTPSVSKDIQWQGDWAFRRERLEVVDSYFRTMRPDLILFQEVMAKRSNAFDSDFKILSSGSLIDYTWQSLKVKTHHKTEESEFVSVVSGYPIYGLGSQGLRNKIWLMDGSNYLSAFIVSSEKQRVGVFILKLDITSKSSAIKNFSFISEKIKNFLVKHDICQKRIILAVDLQVNTFETFYDSFIAKFDLKDPAQEKCLNNPECYTSSSSNHLYKIARKDRLSEGRDLRILTHNDAKVFSSNINLKEIYTREKLILNNEELKINPTLKYGWTMTFRLAHCKMIQL